MRWFFPNFALARLEYFKRLLAIFGLYFLLASTAQVMEGASRERIGVTIVVGILSLVLVFANFNVLWWRIRSCFETKAAVWVWFILSFVPFVGILWLFWPPRAGLQPEPETAANKVPIVIGSTFVLVLVTGIIAAIALPAYKMYVEKAETMETSSVFRQSADNIASAVEFFAKENLTWPDNETELTIEPLPQGIVVRVRDNHVVIRSANRGVRLSMSASFEAGEISWQCNSSGLDSRAIPNVCH